MSTFPVPDYLAENAARLEKMSKDFGATLPKDMAAAISLMSHPAAGVAALTALGFGVAGQAFGMWAGAVAGAAEASQRLFTPLAPDKCDKTEPCGKASVRAGREPSPSMSPGRSRLLKVRGQDRAGAAGRRQGRTGRRACAGGARPSRPRRPLPRRNRPSASWPKAEPAEGSRSRRRAVEAAPAAAKADAPP